MAQSDLFIANAPGAVVRLDINDQIEALASNHAGPTAPPVTFANMWWFDETNQLLKKRNNANTGWVIVAKHDANGWTPYRLGTPLGDAAIRSIGLGAGTNLLDIDALDARYLAASGQTIAVFSDTPADYNPDSGTGTDAATALQDKIDELSALVLQAEANIGLRNNIRLVVDGLRKIGNQITVKKGVILDCRGVLYNHLADQYQFGMVFEPGSHVAQLNYWGRGNCGVDFGAASAACDMLVDKVRMWNIGEEATGTFTPGQDLKVGARFRGFNFEVGAIQIDGGNIGVDYDGASDMRAAHPPLVVTASTAFRITSGCEHFYVPELVADSPNYLGLQLDSSSDIKTRLRCFFNESAYPAEPVLSSGYAVQLGQFSSGDPVEGLDLEVDLANTGGVGVMLNHIHKSRVRIAVRNGSLHTAESNPTTHHAEAHGSAFTQARAETMTLEFLGEATSGRWNGGEPPGVLVLNPLREMFESPEQAVGSGSHSVTVSHGLGGLPSKVVACLRCKTADQGYSVGDEIEDLQWQTTADNEVGHSTWKSATQVGVVFAHNSGNSLKVPNKSGTGLAEITPSRWRWVIRAWR